MQPADLLTLTRLLKDRLSRARMRGHATAAELEDAVENCETLILELESLSSGVAKERWTPIIGQICGVSKVGASGRFSGQVGPVAAERSIRRLNGEQ